MNHPYLPNTTADREAMLAAIGVKSFDELVDYIPSQHLKPPLNIPSAMSEMDLTRQLKQMSGRNATTNTHACFLGAGAANHYIPPVIGSLISRGEFLTSYTPYQPEVAQGTLQAGFEFQTMLCDLFNMEVANLGMYDGVTAFAEAALMACRLTKRKKVAVLNTVDKRMLEVTSAYTKWQDVEIVVVSPTDPKLDSDTAALAIQSPNFFGSIEDVQNLSRQIHDAGGLSIVHTHPLAVGLFKSPGELGADIITAEGQPLGVPLSYGGAYIGLFMCRQAHVRQMPGRIAGFTRDRNGKAGYVLTLQTREQHIRRARATSNICTSTQLVALMVTIYLSLMGSANLRRVAEICYHNAHYAAQAIAALPGYELITARPFFNEFAVRCPRPPAQINAELLRDDIIGGLDISDRLDNGMLFYLSELNTREQIDALVRALGQGS